MNINLLKTMTKKEIKSEIDEYLHENNGDLNKTLDVFVEENLRDLFNFNNWDECDSHEKIIEYGGKKYKITIKEDGCCEATHEHRIMYWTHTIEEVK